MEHGISEGLVLAALFAWGVSFLALRSSLGTRRALAAAFVKTALPVVYFAYFDDGTWRLRDDLSYAEGGASLLDRGDPLALLLDPERRIYLFGVAGGIHVGHYYANALAQWLFGVHYYSAVFFGVVATALASRWLYRLVQSDGFSESYCRGVALFTLFHWEVLVWSSLLNLKDATVMALTVLLLLTTLQFVRRPSFVALLAVAGGSLVTFFYRWYVLVLVFGVVGVWAIFTARGWRRFALSATGVVMALAFANLVPGGKLHPGQWLTGTVRFTLTPRPWDIRPSYDFLILPMVLHWATLPLAVWGGVHLWLRSSVGRLVIIYLAAALLLYGLVEQLQEPRHRAQVAFAFAWLQFHGAAQLVGEVLGPRGASLRPWRSRDPGRSGRAPGRVPT